MTDMMPMQDPGAAQMQQMAVDLSTPEGIQRARNLLLDQVRRSDFQHLNRVASERGIQDINAQMIEQAARGDRDLEGDMLQHFLQMGGSDPEMASPLEDVAMEYTSRVGRLDPRKAWEIRDTVAANKRLRESFAGDVQGLGQRMRENVAGYNTLGGGIYNLGENLAAALTFDLPLTGAERGSRGDQILADLAGDIDQTVGAAEAEGRLGRFSRDQYAEMLRRRVGADAIKEMRDAGLDKESLGEQFLRQTIGLTGDLATFAVGGAVAKGVTKGLSAVSKMPQWAAKLGGFISLVGAEAGLNAVAELDAGQQAQIAFDAERIANETGLDIAEVRAGLEQMYRVQQAGIGAVAAPALRYAGPLVSALASRAPVAGQLLELTGQAALFHGAIAAGDIFAQAGASSDVVQAMLPDLEATMDAHLYAQTPQAATYKKFLTSLGKGDGVEAMKALGSYALETGQLAAMMGVARSVPFVGKWAYDNAVGNDIRARRARQRVTDEGLNVLRELRQEGLRQIEQMPDIGNPEVTKRVWNQAIDEYERGFKENPTAKNDTVEALMDQVRTDPRIVQAMEIGRVMRTLDPERDPATLPGDARTLREEGITRGDEIGVRMDEASRLIETLASDKASSTDRAHARAQLLALSNRTALDELRTDPDAKIAEVEDAIVRAVDDDGVARQREFNQAMDRGTEGAKAKALASVADGDTVKVRTRKKRGRKQPAVDAETRVVKADENQVTVRLDGEDFEGDISIPRQEVESAELATPTRIKPARKVQQLVEDPADYGPQQARDVDVGEWVNRNAVGIGKSEFGKNKAFISDLWEAFQKENPGRLQSIDDFKKQLLQAAQERKVELVRADLVEAMPKDKVAQSEIKDLMASFHFVRGKEAAAKPVARKAAKDPAPAEKVESPAPAPRQEIDATQPYQEFKGVPRNMQALQQRMVAAGYRYQATKDKVHRFFRQKADAEAFGGKSVKALQKTKTRRNKNVKYRLRDGKVVGASAMPSDRIFGNLRQTFSKRWRDLHDISDGFLGISADALYDNLKQSQSLPLKRYDAPSMAEWKADPLKSFGRQVRSTWNSMFAYGQQAVSVGGKAATESEKILQLQQVRIAENTAALFNKDGGILGGLKVDDPVSVDLFRVLDEAREAADVPGYVPKYTPEQFKQQHPDDAWRIEEARAWHAAIGRELVDSKSDSKQRRQLMAFDETEIDSIQRAVADAERTIATLRQENPEKGSEEAKEIRRLQGFVRRATKKADQIAERIRENEAHFEAQYAKFTSGDFIHHIPDRYVAATDEFAQAHGLGNFIGPPSSGILKRNQRKLKESGDLKQDAVLAMNAYMLDSMDYIGRAEVDWARGQTLFGEYRRVRYLGRDEMKAHDMVELPAPGGVRHSGYSAGFRFVTSDGKVYGSNKVPESAGEPARAILMYVGEMQPGDRRPDPSFSAQAYADLMGGSRPVIQEGDWLLVTPSYARSQMLIREGGAYQEGKRMLNELVRQGMLTEEEAQKRELGQRRVIRESQEIYADALGELREMSTGHVHLFDKHGKGKLDAAADAFETYFGLAVSQRIAGLIGGPTNVRTGIFTIGMGGRLAQSIALHQPIDPRAEIRFLRGGDRLVKEMLKGAKGEDPRIRRSYTDADLERALQLPPQKERDAIIKRGGKEADDLIEREALMAAYKTGQLHTTQFLEDPSVETARKIQLRMEARRKGLDPARFSDKRLDQPAPFVGPGQTPTDARGWATKIMRLRSQWVRYGERVSRAGFLPAYRELRRSGMSQKDAETGAFAATAQSQGHFQRVAKSQLMRRSAIARWVFALGNWGMAYTDLVWRQNAKNFIATNARMYALFFALDALGLDADSLVAEPISEVPLFGNALRRAEATADLRIPFAVWIRDWGPDARLVYETVGAMTDTLTGITPEWSQVTKAWTNAFLDTIPFYPDARRVFKASTGELEFDSQGKVVGVTFRKLGVPGGGEEIIGRFGENHTATQLARRMYEEHGWDLAEMLSAVMQSIPDKASGQAYYQTHAARYRMEAYEGTKDRIQSDMERRVGSLLRGMNSSTSYSRRQALRDWDDMVAEYSIRLQEAQIENDVPARKLKDRASEMMANAARQLAKKTISSGFLRSKPQGSNSEWITQILREADRQQRGAGGIFTRTGATVPNAPELYRAAYINWSNGYYYKKDVERDPRRATDPEWLADKGERLLRSKLPREQFRKIQEMIGNR